MVADLCGSRMCFSPFHLDVARVRAARGKKQNGAPYFLLRYLKKKKKIFTYLNISGTPVMDMSTGHWLDIFIRPIIFKYAKWLILYFLHLARFCTPWKWRLGKCPPQPPSMFSVTTLLYNERLTKNSPNTILINFALLQCI